MIGESTGQHHLDRAIQEIDAGVFSSDVLWNPHARRVFQAYLARWLKASVETENTLEVEDDEYGADDYVDFAPLMEENAAKFRRGTRR